MQKGILETNDHLRATFDLHSSFPSFLSYALIFKDQFYVQIHNIFPTHLITLLKKKYFISEQQGILHQKSFFQNSKEEAIEQKYI